MTPALQQKLLRVIQEREFERLGGNKRIPIHARFVAATNRDLEKAVEQGEFLEDLFFRLNVMTISVPPLRERKEDIPQLVDHFLKQYAQRTNEKSRIVSTAAMKLLCKYDYPGNVRELKNTLDRCQITERSGVIMPDSLPSQMRSALSGKHQQETVHISELELDSARDQFEQQFLDELLKTTNGNVTEAAEKARVDRRTIQRMLKKHHMDADIYRLDS